MSPGYMDLLKPTMTDRRHPRHLRPRLDWTPSTGIESPSSRRKPRPRQSSSEMSPSILSCNTQAPSSRPKKRNRIALDPSSPGPGSTFDPHEIKPARRLLLMHPRRHPALSRRVRSDISTLTMRSLSVSRWRPRMRNRRWSRRSPLTTIWSR